MTTLRYKLLADIPPPEYKTAGASGIDLCAAERVTILHGHTKRVPLGISVEIPPRFEAQIRPRSSLSAKGIFCHLGTIDGDYRGEIAAVITSLRSYGDRIVIEKGDRIAQLVIAPVERVELVRVEQLSETARGSGGFGSTGK
jgi:dUTP pyrophosphatase